MGLSNRKSRRISEEEWRKDIQSSGYEIQFLRGKVNLVLWKRHEVQIREWQENLLDKKPKT